MENDAEASLDFSDDADPLLVEDPRHVFGQHVGGDRRFAAADFSDSLSVAYPLF